MEWKADASVGGPRVEANGLEVYGMECSCVGRSVGGGGLMG
jgi:hypothetical protein